MKNKIETKIAETLAALVLLSPIWITLLFGGYFINLL